MHSKKISGLTYSGPSFIVGAMFAKEPVISEIRKVVIFICYNYYIWNTILNGTQDYTFLTDRLRACSCGE